uniref:Sorting nexin-25 n=1 Tax=Phallusia mammillata TaxID=59560 RepID=A0A6F9DTJ3_9ASCI|nr:sorting nexin-25 [Phallusia mammillata]
MWKNLFLKWSVAVTALSIVIIKPGLIFYAFNVLLTILALLLGSVLGVAVIIFMLNHVEKHPPEMQDHLKEERKQYLDRVKTARFWVRWLYYSQFAVLRFGEKLTRRLAQSPLVKMQLGTSPTTNNSGSRSTDHSQGIYETIRPYGLTPPEMLASAYGPTAFGSESTICVSTNIDEILHRIFEYTYRDYVEIWYGKVSADRGNFHKMIRADYWDVVKAFTERLAKLDTVNLLMNRFVNQALDHFKELKITAKTSPEEVKPTFTLNPCLRNQNTELAFLRQISEYIIILTLPPESAKISSLRYILREVLAGLAFLPMVETLCDPDYINQTILMYLQHRDNDQDDQTKAYAYAATYEDFIKIINDCKSLSVLKQIRYRIMTEIIHATTISSLKKDQTKAGKARSKDKGELLMNRNLRRYINQCQVAKQQCERKIRSLGGDEYGSKFHGAHGNVMENQLLSFDEIMKSPISRSYFLKYLKKIGKAPLLKFWSQVDILQTTNPSGKDLARLVSQMFSQHILPGSPEEISLEVDKSTVKGMQECVLGNKGPTDFITVQKQIYELLEKDHYPSFVVSEVYINQLMPEISDQSPGHSAQSEETDMSKAAFGSTCHVTDVSLENLRIVEQKLEFKAQALESLRTASNLDPKVRDQLKHEIQVLQHQKLKQQLHIERTNMWWDHMGKWDASIESVGLSDDEGPVVPTYTIVVQCSGAPFYRSNDDVSGWIVSRTLTEFHELHQSLRECSNWLKKRNLPKLPLLRIRSPNDKFLLESKAMLNQYLQDIIKDEILRCSQILYCFLSATPDLIELSPNLDSDMPSGNGKLSNLGSFLMRLPKDIMDRVVKQAADEEDADLDLPEEEEDGAFGKDSVAAPLYRLIEEIFELHGLFRFLRRSLIIFVRVAFGRSINRQVRETSEWLVSEPMMVWYLQMFIDSMWPGGKLAEAAPQRTENEKLQTKLEVQVRLLQNIPEALNGLVGHENARRGTLKMFHALQDRRLNKHLFYNLLAETVEELFPEVVRSPPIGE